MRPKKHLRALNRQAETGCMQIQNRPAAIFFHPDCTVGTGITPVQLARADFTAGRDSHPALKTYGGSTADLFRQCGGLKDLKYTKYSCALQTLP